MVSMPSYGMLAHGIRLGLQDPYKTAERNLSPNVLYFCRRQTNEEFGSRDFVWGWAEPSEWVELSVAWKSRDCIAADHSVETPCVSGGSTTYNTTASSSDGYFSIQVNPESANHEGTFKITTQGGETAEANGVLSGDVILCSGQSNMALPLSYVFGGQEAINASVHRSSYMRIFQVGLNASDTPITTASGSWEIVSPETIPHFSAVCYLTATEIADLHSGTRPLGLIQSAWGGTPVEAWMSEQMLDEPCPFDGQQIDEEAASARGGHGGEASSSSSSSSTRVNPAAVADEARKAGLQPEELATRLGLDLETGTSVGGPHNDSVLYNAMIHPLIGKAFRSVLWFQGEADVISDTRHTYACRFASMINGWRDAWDLGDFGFNYVQLAAYFDSGNITHIREAQAMTLPKPFGPVDTTGVAPALDKGDPTAPMGAIHSRRKAEVARRLALATLHTAYAQQAPGAANWSGPSIVSMQLQGQAQGPVDLSVEFQYSDGLAINDTAECTECCAPAQKGDPTAMVQLCSPVGTVMPGETPCVNGSLVQVNQPTDPTAPGLPARSTAEFRFDHLPAGALRVLSQGGAGASVDVRVHSADYPQCVILNGNGIPAIGQSANVSLAHSSHTSVQGSWDLRAAAEAEAEARGDTMLLAVRQQDGRRRRRGQQRAHETGGQTVRPSMQQRRQAAERGVRLGLLRGSAVHSAPNASALWPSPPLGLNTWNSFHASLSERLIRQIADEFVSMGLKDLGYEYVNLDDAWQADRFPNGTIVPDPVRFPTGMRALADYCHSKGLKFGLYTAQREFTCQRRPGSYKHELIDGATYCDWDIDYLKIDHCGGAGWPALNQSWILFKQAFDDCYSQRQHAIFQSVESCGSPTGCGEWIPDVANSWRTHGDVQANWNSVMANLETNNLMKPVMRPGHFNDADVRTTRIDSQLDGWIDSPIPLACPACSVRVAVL